MKYIAYCDSIEKVREVCYLLWLWRRADTHRRAPHCNLNCTNCTKLPHFLAQPSVVILGTFIYLNPNVECYLHNINISAFHKYFICYFICWQIGIVLPLDSHCILEFTHFSFFTNAANQPIRKQERVPMPHMLEEVPVTICYLVYSHSWLRPIRQQS